MRFADRPGLAAVTLLAIVGPLVAGCSSSTTSVSSRSSAPPAQVGSGSVGAVSSSPGGSSTSTSPRVETNPPGDIPDNQAFVAFRGTGYSVTVPEGWARTVRADGAVFTDKYNSVTVTTRAASAAPTAASVRATEVSRLRASTAGFVLKAISVVTRKAGTAVLITYRALSPVNPVTGKVAREAVERYEFWRNGRQVDLTLAAPQGSDNVDPWRIVTDSFGWAP